MFLTLKKALNSFRRHVSLFALLVAFVPAVANGQGASDWVTIEYSVKPVTSKIGQFALSAAIEIRDDWKMYAFPTEFPPYSVDLVVAELPDGVTVQDEIVQSETKKAYDTNFGKDVHSFQHEAQIARLVDVSNEADPAGIVSGHVLYQICSDSRGLCLPPTKDLFSVTVKEATDCMNAGSESCAISTFSADPLGINGSSTGGAGGATDALAAAELDASDFGTDRGVSLAFLLLAIGAGFGALLTPCVFPMVPLTVSFFAKSTESRSGAIRMAMIYGASIVVTFTGLGVVMASVYGAAGVQTIASNPWVNLFFASILIAFALSLLGLYELRLPNSLLNYFNRQSNERSGWLGVVFMGLTLTLVSFSCTVPFVGGLLAAAARGTWIRPVIGMAAFSSAFALPFVLLALFPKLLQSLPKSGSWMNGVKVTLGFVELAAAIKFLSNADLVWGWNLISRPLAIAVTVVIFFMAGLYLIGKLRLKHEEIDPTVGVPRLMAAIGFFGVSLYLIPGLFGSPLNSLDAFLPPRQATDIRLLGDAQFSGGLDDGWIVDDIDSALATAARESRPVFVDFTGYTCTNCRQMEATVFPVPAVADLLENDFVLLRLYTDDQETGDEFQRYQLQLTGTVALPTYAILAHADGSLVAKTSGLQSAEKFAAFLRAGYGAALIAMN